MRRNEYVYGVGVRYSGVRIFVLSRQMEVKVCIGWGWVCVRIGYGGEADVRVCGELDMWVVGYASECVCVWGS